MALLMNSNMQLLPTLFHTCSNTKLLSSCEADALCPVFTLEEPPGGVWGPAPLLMPFSAAVDPELVPPLGTDTWPGMALKDVER